MSTIVTNRTSAADNGRSNPKHVQFYGKKDEDFDLWLENFLARTKRIRLSDPAEHLELFRASLEGTARHAFDNLDAIHRSSIDLAAHKLRGVFTFTRKQQWLAHFGDAKYESEEETFQLFGVRVGRLNRKAYPELAESPHLEMLCVQSFIAGLPSDLRKVVGSQEPTTLDDAIIVAEKHDAIVKLTRRWDPKKLPSKSYLTSMKADDSKSEPVELFDKAHGGKQPITLCSLQQNINSSNKQQHQKLGEIGKTLADLTKANPAPKVVTLEAPVMTPNHYNPYRFDNRPSFRPQHYSSHYRKPYDRTSFNQIRCWNCGGQGHVQAKCPKFDQVPSRQTQRSNRASPPPNFQARPQKNNVALNI